MASYRQPCPIARALDAVGEKWSLLIVRDLIRRGPMRFQDLERGLPGIATNTLSARLRALEAKGIVTSRLYSKHPPRLEYLLTERGVALGPILSSLYAWGKQC